MLVVVNQNESTVSVVDVRGGTILATLPTGEAPREVAASPDGRWAVVTDYGAGEAGSTLTVVDLISLTITRRISLGEYRRPHGIRFLADNQTVAVTSETGGVVLLVGIPSGRIERAAPTGQPASRLVVVARDGRVAYTANLGSGSVSAVDLAGGGPPRTLAVAPQTEAIALSPDGFEVWVGSNVTGRVYVVDTESWSVVDSLATSGPPARIAFSRDGSRVLVSNPGTDELWLFDARTHDPGERIAVPPGAPGETPAPSGPARPFGIAWAPDGRTAWVSLQAAGRIAEVDLEGRAVRRYLPAGAGADGIAFADRPPA